MAAAVCKAKPALPVVCGMTRQRKSAVVLPFLKESPPGTEDNESRCTQPIPLQRLSFCARQAGFIAIAGTVFADRMGRWKCLQLTAVV
jgi:hypothetical protein